MALYHDSLMNTNNGGPHNVVSVAFTAAGQAASIGLHHPPHILSTQFLPPPNYSEAVALNSAGGPLPVHTTQTFDHLHSAATGGGYDVPAVSTCTVGGEYQGGTLPPTGMLGLTSNHF